MRYKLYYSDYHSHIWTNEFEAETDDKAKEKANEIVHGLGYDDDTLYRENEDGTLTEIDW